MANYKEKVIECHVNIYFSHCQAQTNAENTWNAGPHPGYIFIPKNYIKIQNGIYT